MSEDVVSCFEDEAAESAMDKMEHYRIRRLPVVDREQFLVGMLSLGDLSAKGDAQKAGQTLNVISQPGERSLAGVSVADDQDIVPPADQNRDPLTTVTLGNTRLVLASARRAAALQGQQRAPERRLGSAPWFLTRPGGAALSSSGKPAPEWREPVST